MRASLVFAFGLCCFLLALPARADSRDEPRQIAQFQNWSAYRVMDHGNKVCYMAAQPKPVAGKDNKKGKTDRRGDIYALITNRPADGARNVFSYITGYTYKSGSDVTVTVDGHPFTLFTQDDTAWAPDGATDNKISDAIRRGKAMTVTGVSARGTKTTDSFDLAGAKAAYGAIAKECNSK